MAMFKVRDYASRPWMGRLPAKLNFIRALTNRVGPIVRVGGLKSNGSSTAVIANIALPHDQKSVVGITYP